MKSEAQQSGLMLHRSRQLLVCQRTMLSNAIRAHMAELGIISAKASTSLSFAEAMREQTVAHRTAADKGVAYRYPGGDVTGTERHQLCRIPTINSEVNAGLADPMIKARFADLGGSP